MKTITITKGNQYNADGYSMTDGNLDAYGEIAKKMDGTIGVTRDGRCTLGCDYDNEANEAKLKQAIRETIADGKERVLTFEPTTKSIPMPKINEPLRKPCPLCGTYCYGDCQS